MAPHSSTLAWKIPWTEEPGKLQSMGSLRVGHDWATSLSRVGEGNGNPLQCSCLENPRDGGAWWAGIYGAAQSQTQLTWLSSSSFLHAWKESLEVDEQVFLKMFRKLFQTSKPEDLHCSWKRYFRGCWGDDWNFWGTYVQIRVEYRLTTSLK